MTRLAEKVALITGGASGVGLGVAKRFVEEGAQVVITDISPNGASVAQQLGAQFLEQDVRSEEGWEQVVEEVSTRYGRLHSLVNNAGIFSSHPVDETPLEEWQNVLDVNLTGVFLGCKYGVQQMKRNANGGGGSIINLSSVVGLRGQMGGAAYGASKGGVRLLTKSVALENAGLGIRCNSVHPGVIETPILDPLFAAADDAEAMRTRIEASLPMGFMGDPAQDIGNLAVFLASEESRYITGAEMVCDGGMTIGLP